MRDIAAEPAKEKDERDHEEATTKETTLEDDDPQGNEELVNKKWLRTSPTKQMMMRAKTKHPQKNL